MVYFINIYLPGGGGGHDSRSLDAAADQLLGALKPKIVASNNNIDNGDANSMLKQQFQKLNLGQVKIYKILNLICFKLMKYFFGMV